jgi:signal transduction histidine kinase/AmiR/NasT family two-component response regulator
LDRFFTSEDGKCDGRSAGAALAAGLLAAVIFFFDTYRTEAATVAVFYGVVILLSVSFTRPAGVLAIAAGCAGLTVVSHFLNSGDSVVRCVVSLCANGVTTVLAVRGQTARAELARARDVAEATNRAKGEFLANMSHEIRTPLNGVLGVASVLAQTRLSIRQREMVELVVSSGETLQSLLTDILDMARVESGRLVVQSEPIDVRRAIHDAWALARIRAEEKGLGGHLRVDPGAPTWMLGDEIRLKQILGNLLGNAVKFTERGDVSLHVEMAEGPQGPQLCLRVIDTGIGIQSDVLPQLFQRFAQADGGVTRRFGGSGLGLAISRSLAEMMGGTLTAASVHGRGSCFTLRLPVIAAEAPEATAPEVELVALTAEAAPPRVLLAEDNATNAKVVSLMLESVGVSLVWVENGYHAVERARAEPFDLILMDMQMPVLDGLSAIEQIRASVGGRTPSTAPIIALTANALPEDRARCLAAGADFHVSKPIEAAQLLLTMEQALSGAAQSGAAQSKATATA